jgi:hypothetical protein
MRPGLLVAIKLLEVSDRAPSSMIADLLLRGASENAR